MSNQSQMLSSSLLKGYVIYLEVNIVILQLALRNQRRLHWAKLRALWDASLGEDSTQEAVDEEDLWQTGTGFRHHRPVRDGVQGAVLQTHRGVGTVTLLTP